MPRLFATSLCKLVVLAVLLQSAVASGQAHTYPNRPIRMLVGFAPAGSTDIIARMMAQKLGDALGQRVVVDNRPAGGGIIAAQIVAKAAADGYTLIMGTSSTFGVNPALYTNLGYDPVTDFAPIIFVSLAPNVLTVPAAIPAQSVQDLVTLAKSSPGKMNFASSGTGGAAHVAGELFKLVAGIDIVHVPYKGTWQALADLIGGQVQLSFATVVSVLPHVKSGKLRALGVTSPKRVHVMPNVPTMAEANYPAVNAVSWNGLLAPARTNRAIVERLNREIRNILNDRETREQMLLLGAEASGGTPDEFARYIKAEIVKWDKVVKAAGLRKEHAGGRQ